MRLAVVGSRSIVDYHEVEWAIRSSPWAQESSPKNWDMELVSGGADGVDACAEQFAREYNLPIDVLKPDWSDWSDGHPALDRNTEIVESADAVVAVWNGRSNGTRDSIDKALDSGTPVYVKVVE